MTTYLTYFCHVKHSWANRTSKISPINRAKVIANQHLSYQFPFLPIQSDRRIDGEIDGGFSIVFAEREPHITLVGIQTRQRGQPCELTLEQADPRDADIPVMSRLKSNI